MSDWEYNTDDALMAAALDADGDGGETLMRTLAAKALADDADADRVADLDRKLADYTPNDALDKDTRARLQAQDRADLLARDVPSTVVEMAMPAMYAASARVRGQAEALVARAEGVEVDSPAYDQVMLALRDLLAGAGLRPSPEHFVRAHREDSPTVGDLAARWSAAFDKPAPAPRDDDGEGEAKTYRPARWW